MALQVWLPLTKDLRNQGLSDVTISIMRGNETWDNNGKLGKCFYANGVNTLQINNIVPQLYNADGYSLCAWFYIESQNTVHSGASIISGGNWNHEVLNLAVSDWSSDHYTRLRVSGTNWNNTYSYNFYKNIWYHAVVCSDGNKTYAYINGQLIGNTVAGFLPSSIEGNNIAIGGATYYNGMQFFGKINDVRIYDHCLSPMEVKKLSKGLVLHYPLNRGGWGQENLLPVNGSTIINSTQSFEFQGWVQNFYTKTWMNEHLTPGKQYTLSYTVTCLSIPDSTYIFKENRHSPILVHQGNGWNQVTITSDGIKSTNMAVGQSRDYKCTFIFAMASENYEYYGLCGYTALYRNSSNNAQYAKFRIDNLKLEEGSITTPWCPNSSDNLADEIGLNSIIEYDTSGYCNNGTKNNISYTSDTPKYAVSSVFNGSNSYIKVNDNNWMIKGMSEMTVNLWAKATTWPTNGGRLLSCTESGGFNLEGGNSGYWRFSIYVYTNSGQTSSAYKYDSNEIKIADLIPDEWNMITLVYDNTGTKTYLNGELHHTYTNTSYGINFNTNARLFLGCEANTANPSAPYFNGKESDFRIYATVLSADDIKSLYQNCMTIDPDGTIRGKIRS